jgi:hypothetical protein
MRMDTTRGQSAAQWLATAEVDQIAQVIRDYGEERFAFPVAKAIVARREERGPLASTAELAQLVAGAVKTREPGQDPATRTFQALRIFVNAELEELEQALSASLDLLQPEGRLVVISFHSLEDRIVKQFIARHSREVVDRRVPFAQGQVLKLEALERIKDIGASPEALAKMTNRELWTLNLKAALLNDAGRTDEALAVLDAVASLPAEGRPNTLAFRIIAADMAEEASRHADALTRVAAADSADLNDYGKQALAGIRVCALARSGKLAEAQKIALLAGWTKEGNNRALQAAFACLGRLDAAAAVLIKRLDDESSRDDALFELQPFLINDRPNAPDKLTKAALRALKARPDVKAAFLKHGRDLPAAIAPPR